MDESEFAAAFPFGESGRLGCSFDPLVQLGLPGPRELAIWCARGQDDSLDYAVESVRCTDPATHLSEREPAYRVARVSVDDCSCLRISGLSPGRHYLVRLTHPSRPPIELACATAPSSDGAFDGGREESFSFLAFSCFAPFTRSFGGRVPPGNERTLRALGRCASRPLAARPAFALGMGDQVYVDEGARGPIGGPSHSLLRGTSSQGLRYQPDRAPRYFDVLYRAHFSLGLFDSALRGIPSAMMWDDHELRDGWGSHGDEGHPRWQAHAMTARRYFLRYQLLRSARCFPDGEGPLFEAGAGPDPRGRFASTHYRFDWGRRATFFMLDERSQRHVRTRSDGSATGGVLGKQQLRDLEAWLTQESSDALPRVFVLVSPVPLTTPGWFRADPTGHIPFRHDDRHCRWWSPENRPEARKLLRALVARFGQGTKDRLLILSGDVHYSEVRELSLPDGGPVFGHEIISSGLAQSSFPTWNGPMYELNEAWPAFPEILTSKSLGRHLGGGFAELHVRPASHDLTDACEVRVLFHFGDSQRDVELARWLGTRADDEPSRARWKDFEVDPFRHGALLDLRPRAHAAEGPVHSCLRAHGSDRVRAILQAERLHIDARRARRRDARANDDSGAVSFAADAPLSGLALSGGGIRSATICIGFMQLLQQRKLLDSFDYVSSVSGGSYANGYMQVMSSPELLARMGIETPREQALDEAFSEASIQRLHEKSRYLALGSGLAGAFNFVRLGTSFLTSLIQHWLWLASVFVTLGYVGKMAAQPLHRAVFGLSALAALTVLTRMVLAHGPRAFKPRLQRLLEDRLNGAESLIFLALVITGGPLLWQGLPGLVESWAAALLAWVPEGEPDPLSVWVSAGVACLVPAGLSVAWRRGLTLTTRLAQGLVFGAKALCCMACVLVVSFLLSQAKPALTAWTLPPSLHLLAVAHPDGFRLALSAFVTLVLTLITSPNSTSLHRYYSARLADAFFARRAVAHAAGERRDLRTITRRLVANLSQQTMLLREIADSSAPYPLFNGCVNLVGRDPEFAGDQTSDYFVFAPHHCGSKLTGYALTAYREQYGRLTLAEAVTCSGAAISPFQGRSMPSAMSILLWLLNLRTDLWLPNPNHRRKGFWAKVLSDHRMPWGPVHQLAALGGRLDTHSPFVNVSDGGFIDNLGIYELLRRRCQRIVAIDATWDPRYEFEYLRNLVVRARQELEVDFEFDEQPEQVIRPRVTDGLSEKCVITATIRWPAAEDREPGRLYYVKAAIPRTTRRPRKGLKVADPSRAYGTYHPSFPQESTGDQFFDPVQARAYHDLGRLLARHFLDEPSARAVWGGVRFSSMPPDPPTWRKRA